MRLLKSLALAAILCTAGVAQAQSATPRAIFEQGAAAYVKDGATAAIAAWLKGGALEFNTQATSQTGTMLQVEGFFGKPEGFEVLQERALSSRTAIVLGAIYYEKGPVYARFQAFKLASGGWVATDFKFNTDAVQVLPSSVLEGRP